MTPSTQSASIQSNLVTLELPLEDSPRQMEETIRIALAQWGDPLRWAVMAVDVANQIVRVEAIVTQQLVHDTCP
ncbi:MAG: hypothetical protein ACO3EZ_11910 [Prochlorotrichaceae cyanobacterium]